MVEERILGQTRYLLAKKVRIMTELILLYSFSRMVNVGQKISILLITVNDILNFWIKGAARHKKYLIFCRFWFT